MQSLLLGESRSEESVAEREMLYGWDFSKGLFSVVLETEEGFTAKNEFRNAVFADVFDAFPTAIFTKVREQTVFLCNARFKEYKTFRLTLTKRAETYTTAIPAFHIGISAYKHTCMDVKEIYDEAVEAIRIGKIITKSFCFYPDMLSYSLVDRAVSEKDRYIFVRQVLGPLIDYDEKYRSDYIDTLMVLFRSDYILKATAKELYLHYNSLKYRITRIKEILSVDLNDYQTRINIGIALHMMEISEPGAFLKR